VTVTAPLIVGLSGTTLTADERTFLAAVRPFGIILFARNVSRADDLAGLVAEAKAASGAPLAFVDQEGGRVQRLRPPLAPRYPPAAAIGALHAANPAAGIRAAFLAGRLIGADLRRFGIDSPCLPVADVPASGAHDVIGDRAYARDPAVVATLAAAAAEGVLAAGGLPVAKHIPGHGRAAADSHHELPTVTADRTALEADFAPFRALAALPMAMTAHIRYSVLDPDRPATLSPGVVALIRGEIGFDGLLMTDDISMRALSGDLARNAAAALEAGCDCVLHCNGDLAEMAALAAALPPLGGAAARRLEAALAARRTPDDAPLGELRAEFDALLATAAA
jgi:beta-N-acetylhexosaminidase